MGINTISRGMVTIFLIAIIYLGFTPTVHNLAVDEHLWGNVTDSRSLFLRDNAVLIFQVSGVLSFFMTIVWMLNAATSKGAVSQFG